MRKVKIITDSCADLNGEQLKRYDIDYVRMSTVEEGKEAPGLLTWSAEEATSCMRLFVKDGALRRRRSRWRSSSACLRDI